MEIQSLKLLLTDAELTRLVAEATRDEEGLENLSARFTPDGVVLSGEYKMIFRVPFETVWAVRAAGPELHIHLSTVSVAGVPAGILRRVLLKVAREKVEKSPGASVREEIIVIDVPAAAKAEGLDLRVHFTDVTLSLGAAVVEAGAAPL